MYRRTWVLEPDKLHDRAQPVAIVAAKARLVGRPGIQGFKLQRRRRWLSGCPGCPDRYERRGIAQAMKSGGTFPAYTMPPRSRVRWSYADRPTGGVYRSIAINAAVAFHPLRSR